MVEIAGLPVHILLIHAVVVLAPVAGIMAVLFGTWGRSRKYLAWPLGALALLLVPLSVVTAEAGEQLEKARPISELVKQHAEQGSSFRFVTAAFGVVVVLQILAAFPSLLSRWSLLSRFASITAARGFLPLASIAGVIAGLFLTYAAVFTGHSGAASAWSTRQG
jgi:hypothetical protein